MPQKRIASQWLQILRDLLFVLRELWLLLCFNLLAVLAFFLIPQGTDMLLSLLESKTFFGNLIPIAGLMIALFFWSVSSEFCTRFIIYMADNSGHTLSPERVALRKSLQKKLARFFLFFPSTLFILAASKASLQNWEEMHGFYWILCLIITGILLLQWWLWALYRSNQKIQWIKNLHWMQLTEAEKIWTSKLYGIFNDYRVDLHRDELAASLQDLHRDEPAACLQDLPREELLSNGQKIPAGFQLKEKPRVLANNRKIQVWMYRIPIRYYPNLMKQLFILLGIAVVLILGFSFASIQLYQGLGALALICFSFASWQIIYTFLHFLDKTEPIPKLNLGFRFLLVLWICICSYCNNDHPARVAPEKTLKQAQTVSANFESWLSALEEKEKLSKASQIPVFFIASEGGGLRTGAFTAILLAKLQDSFPDFKNHIYCFSGVSGGGLGLQFFHSLPDEKKLLPNTHLRASQVFFQTDFLSAITGKLVFAEPLNYLIPRSIPALDRAIALELAWESAWAKAIGPNESNAFAAGFDEQIGKHQPALFINTVESETGLPCVWSNLLLDSSMALYQERDLRNKFSVSLNYATAINLGTRFPLLSPAALLQNNGLRMHYIDGGYFENKGQQTILDLLPILSLHEHPNVVPLILQFNFSQDDSVKHPSIRFANEFTEVFKGIENARFARASLISESLKQFMHDRYDTQQLIHLNLDISEKKLPMNWLLSQTAMNRIDQYTDSMMRLQKDGFEMQKIFNAIHHLKKNNDEKTN